MKAASYLAIAHDGTRSTEHVLCLERDRELRLMIVPALFAEANRLRRFTVEIMRRLDRAGIDTFLPDLPGCNESLEPLCDQQPDDWYRAMTGAAEHFRATHVLGIRGGGLFVPAGLPGWRHAPVNGASQLKQMMRARILASREDGRTESREGLLQQGLAEGLDLQGYRLGPQFVAAFPSLTPQPTTILADIPQEQLGGPGLWLLAEPGENADQSDRLAALIAQGMDA